MERIGLAASKMSQGNLAAYNFYVVLLSFLFSFLIFTLAGATLIFSLIIIRYTVNEIMGVTFMEHISTLIGMCLVSLSVILGLFNLLAIGKNIKVKK